jgi:hydroxyacylglutathione hydrolase
VLDYLRSKDLDVAAILTTHYHSDHSAGNEELKRAFPSAAVYGYSDRTPAVSNLLRDGERFSINGLSINALHTPCHTQEHLCYYVTEADDKAVFTGDTLFSAGCGRFFEGTAEDMVKSLRKLSQLPKETKVYFGHEYTASNLKFAQSICKWDTLENYGNEIVKNEGISVPSTIAKELKVNMFLMLASDDPETEGRRTELFRVLETQDRIEAMRLLRHKKDNFK